MSKKEKKTGIIGELIEEKYPANLIVAIPNKKKFHSFSLPNNVSQHSYR